MARRPEPNGTPPSTGIGHVVDLVRSSVPPLHPEGIRFVAPPLVLAALGRKHPLVRRTGLVTAAAIGTFFRHPPRVPPNRAGVVVAPADGTVALVDTAVPPAELDLGAEPVPRVSIFLSILDVHVQRSPVTAAVQSVVHRSGQFLSADLADASEVNERNSMHLRTPDGHDIAVVQIAGLIARRIVCHAKAGDTLPIGDTYGLIRFGSRVDTYFPPSTTLLVTVGQRAVGAETVLAELPRKHSV
ncbi:phosphatidylserine decarboxylase proenzyme [Rhodococcoides trifolii]|uniref:Phosphatidylserine decarboxylase proenzyme n=1 Tax=Rhodococcoides trifolii TaxID=908250 RepID=A0A917FQD2_9NOCA|nr:phosphatidylserine decarboxylase [Rhodococcus trifolii]GGF94731.1 phosphatidylserine decarboxylase proenzyme [Rhodococcus trifolii]